MDETSTEAAWSSASRTDQIVFNMLSNVERVDMSRVPATSLSSLNHESRIQDITEETAATGEQDMQRRDMRAWQNELNDDLVHDSYHRIGGGADVVGAAHDDMHAPPVVQQPHATPVNGGDGGHGGGQGGSEDHGMVEPVHTLDTGGSGGGDPRGDHVHPNHCSTDRDAQGAGRAEEDALRRYGDRGRRVPDSEDDVDSKRSVLMDILAMERRGVVFTRKWSMDDRLEDMMLEIRRHTMVEDERKNVDLMRDGLRLMVAGVELVNNRLGLLDLDGWSTDVSRELTKHDDNLARIYRKYCRRSTSRSPETEIAMALVSSMGMHHVKRVMSKTVMRRMSGSTTERRPPPSSSLPKHLDDDSSDDDEGIPDTTRS